MSRNLFLKLKNPAIGISIILLIKVSPNKGSGQDLFLSFSVWFKKINECNESAARICFYQLTERVSKPSAKTAEDVVIQ